MTKTHVIAWCNTCDWRFSEKEGDRRTASGQANTHAEDNGHVTVQSMHRIYLCPTMGCDPQPERGSI